MAKPRELRFNAFNMTAPSHNWADLWGIDAATVEEANSHRSYLVGAVSVSGLSEQQRIADAFVAEGLIPKKVDTSDVKIWAPKGS